MTDLPAPETPCPCTSGRTLGECCGPLLDGSRRAATAEALMRSRYSAYALHCIDHIARTDHPSRQKDFDRKSASEWSTRSRWTGLSILAVEGGQEQDDQGVVEFIASYSVANTPQQHHERATFSRIDGVWYYADGKTPAAKPFRHEAPNTGRNEPCPCGSGRKFKRCHGA